MQKTMHPKILSTYESERRPVAQELINFDRGYAQNWAKSAAASEATNPNGAKTPNGTDLHGAISENGTADAGTPPDTNPDNKPLSFQSMYMQNMVYTTGILIHYHPSDLVLGITGPTSHGPRAVQFEAGLTPGMRLPDFQMLNQSDAVPTQMHKAMKTDGRFRVLVFAGNLTREAQRARIADLAAHLASDEDSFVNVYEPASTSTTSISHPIEIITIHSPARTGVELQELPAVLHPWNEGLGWDYWKVFADDRDIHGEHGEAYRKCGTDETKGALVVVRPDGYLGMVAELTGLGAVNAYFAGFMIPVLREEG